MKRYKYYLYENANSQIVIAVVLCITVGVLRHNRVIDLTGYLDPAQGQQGTLYSTLASIMGSLLGFVIAAGAIVFTVLGSPNLAVVRQSNHAPLLGTIYIRAAYSLGLGAAFSFLLIVDNFRAVCGSFASLILVFILTLVFLQVLACLWVLEEVIKLVVKNP